MTCTCNEERPCIERVPIFNNLDEKEMKEVISLINHKQFMKNELIYMAGQKGGSLYVINSGKVKITRIASSGKEQVIRILEAGEFMGELSIFRSSPLADNAEALEDTNMCIIDEGDLKELLKKYPLISFKIMEELSERLERAESLIENINLSSVEKRLADILLELSDGNKEIVLNLSKKDLASQIGMSSETLSRKLSAFQELGVIKLIGQRKINILNRGALEEI
ncbi:MAG: Crp/Fnr family transcriptional regulator [Tissierella sp.]|uniref:Crp/Fnr family transcriptional regulator n=1 Tax=Tissierella sp. TaxID=41274 RepID=UPI003F9C4E9B